MKVRRLEMTSFRGFRELTLEFKDPVTVLVGVNGAGKTSILDCLAVLLSQVSSGISSRAGYGRRLYDSDIRRGASHIFAAVDVAFDETPTRWSLSYGRRGLPKIASSDLRNLKDVTTRIQKENSRGNYQLPLAIYYPVSRAPNVPMRMPEHYDFGPLSAFDQALDGDGRNFRLFFEWFREREDLENEQRVFRKALDYSDPQLKAVRTAIHTLVPAFSGLRVQRGPQRMVVQKEGTLLEVGQLSDGEKCLLAMAGDLARRLALANPARPDPLSAEAVILIDEIELHLHPGWQRMVVESLTRTFPHCQFLMTTHSPQVLSQVPADSVILLDQFQRAELPAGTLGRDSNSILAEVMHVPERPAATAQRLHEIASLIDKEELPAARNALDELAQQLGAHDSEVVRLRALIKFLGG